MSPLSTVPGPKEASCKAQASSVLALWASCGRGALVFNRLLIGLVWGGELGSRKARGSRWEYAHTMHVEGQAAAQRTRRLSRGGGQRGSARSRRAPHLTHVEHMPEHMPEHMQRGAAEAELRKAQRDSKLGSCRALR